MMLAKKTQDHLRWYLSELLRWNLKINLTGHKNFEAAWEDLILDSLELIPHMVGDNLLDIGTGAGIPGMVLAIACPDRSCILLDSRRKRTNFLSRIVRHLNLGARVSVLTGRAPEVLEGRTFSCITLRAVGSLQDSLALAKPLLAEKGRILLPRAGKDREEALSLGCRVREYTCYGEKRLIAIYQA